MRLTNRTLKMKMPNPEALDPNSTHATSISILRTLLDIRGEYNQKLAVKNAQARRVGLQSPTAGRSARLKLAGNLNERDDLLFRIDDMERKLARLNIDQSKLWTVKPAINSPHLIV